MNYVEKYNLQGTPKVEQFINSQGKPVKNHFVIKFDNGEVFQSYDTIIAVEVFNDYTDPTKNRIYVSPMYKCSTTTLKHFNSWLQMTPKEQDKAFEDCFLVLDTELA